MPSLGVIRHRRDPLAVGVKHWRPRAGGASPRWGYGLFASSQSKAAVQNTMGAMPSQWPSAPSARVKRRKSSGQVSWLNSCLPLAGRDHVSFVVGDIAGAGDLGDGVGVGVPEQVRAVGPDSGDSVGHHPGCEQRLQSGPTPQPDHRLRRAVGRLRRVPGPAFKASVRCGGPGLTASIASVPVRRCVCSSGRCGR